jgi:hypothetical protein
MARLMRLNSGLPDAMAEWDMGLPDTGRPMIRPNGRGRRTLPGSYQLRSQVARQVARPLLSPVRSRRRAPSS